MNKPSLAKGFIVYFIGNAGSKLILLFLLPFITAYLSESEYGYFELINTAVNLFIPVVALQTFEGIIRFLLDADNEKDERGVVSTSFFIVLINLIAFNLFYVIFSTVYNFEYIFFISLYFNITFLFYYFQRIARGLKKQLQFSISGFLSTVGIAATCLFTLMYADMKVDGIIISYFVGNFIAVLYLLKSIDVVKYISFKSFDKKLASRIIKYSFPLLFDAIIWWVMNLSDRSLLSFILGNDSVGIYGVAYKFAAILFFFNTIFYLTWQEYSIIQNKNESSVNDFTEVFGKLLVIQITAVAVLVPFSKIVIETLIAENFSDAFNYVPLLLGGTMFSSFAAFYGMKYQISKKTVSALVTSSVGGVVNLILNIIFIPIWGIWAAAFSTILSFFVLWVVRLIYIRDFVNLRETNIFRFILLLIYASIISVISYHLSLVFIYVMLLLTIVIFVVLNWPIMSELLRKVRLKGK